MSAASAATTQARKDLLETVSEAINQIGRAIAALGTAYENLDEPTADRLEQDLFRPVQLAYGRAQRAHTGFASRSGLRVRTFTPPPPNSPGRTTIELVERAVGYTADADTALSTLQDSMLPVDVGDPQLREDLALTRQALTEVPRRATEFSRQFGR
jgi:hypothetical protein